MGTRGVRRPETPEEKATTQLEDSTRRAIAGWVADPRVAALISEARPFARKLLDQLGIDDPAEQGVAARQILSLGPADGHCICQPDPFEAWPAEGGAPAPYVARAIRAAVWLVVSGLQDRGLTALRPVEEVAIDDQAPDGLRFDDDHVAILLLLWLDVPLEGSPAAHKAAADEIGDRPPTPIRMWTSKGDANDAHPVASSGQPDGASSWEPHMPPWSVPLTEAQLTDVRDKETKAYRRQSDVLLDLHCQACRKTIAWIVVFHGQFEGTQGLELAAPVDYARVDQADRVGTSVAYVLTGKQHSLALPSKYLVGPGGPGRVRITCRCGQRNWLRMKGLRLASESARVK